MSFYFLATSSMHILQQTQKASKKPRFWVVVIFLLFFIIYLGWLFLTNPSAPVRKWMPVKPEAADRPRGKEEPIIGAVNNVEVEVKATISEPPMMVKEATKNGETTLAAFVPSSPSSPIVFSKFSLAIATVNLSKIFDSYDEVKIDKDKIQKSKEASKNKNDHDTQAERELYHKQEMENILKVIKNISIAHEFDLVLDASDSNNVHALIFNPGRGIPDITSLTIEQLNSVQSKK